MPAHALVIGIDKYRHAEWNLTGAVRDAVAFAEWVVDAGSVDPANLTLLLSPVGQVPGAQRATRTAILKAFHAFQKGAAQGADRFWFYYAGHGLAPPGQDPAAGPLVVPADVDDIDFYVNQEPVGLEAFRGAMQNVAPKEQFYFVDACRDVIPIKDKLLAQTLLWDVRGTEDDQLATQAVFLGTTAGQKAKEIRGQGLFGRALLAALRGLGPDLVPVPPVPGEPARRRLEFDDLADFVTRAVKRGLEDLPDLDPADRKGVPYAKVNRITGPISLVEFAAAAVPKARISALVDPVIARESGRIEFLQWNDDESVWAPRTSNPAPVAAPLPEEAQFEVRGGRHQVQITAAGFETVIRELLVYEDKRIPFELLPKPKPTRVPPVAVTRQLIRIDALPAGPVSPLTARSLIVTCRDPKARVAIYDGQGRQLQRGYGSVRQDGLSPGPYRVSAELTAAERVEQTVVLGHGPQAVSVDLATPRSERMAEILRDNGIALDDNYATFPDGIGDVANIRLGSLLAYAAAAARWPDKLPSLHAVGIAPLKTLSPEQSALQVLIGDLAEDGALLDGCRVQVEGRKTPLRLTALPKVSAMQGSATRPAGSVRVQVDLPGFTPTIFAITLLPSYVSTLIITREADGDIDVQQHFNPIDVDRSLGPGFAPPQADDVRLVELAWRALEGRDLLDDVEYGGLLQGKRSNPMLAVIAGYRMFRTERASTFRDEALANMRRLFPELPDVHVLAGLYEPEQRAEHFRRAMDTGTPVVADGFWALTEWLAAEAVAAGRPAPVLKENLVPGSAWTAFTEPLRAARIGDVRMVGTRGRRYVGDAVDTAVLTAAAQAVGLIEAEGRVRATAFLVAPNLALCPRHVAAVFAEEQTDGTWTPVHKTRITFAAGRDADDRRVRRVLRTLRPDDPDPPRGSLSRELLEQCWPVLLELDKKASASPLTIGPAAATGQPVAVIGFPFDLIMPSEVFAQRFAGASGEKHAMLGTVLRGAGESWTLDYDCFTAAGTSGGPVINVDDGTVVGMHVAGTLAEGGSGTGIALSRFADELR